MVFGYIDPTLKPVFLINRPKKYYFETGNYLYIYKQFKNSKKNINNLDLVMIDTYEKKNCKNFVYLKAILQILKENNISEVSFCFDNCKEYFFLLKEMFENKISFSLADCNGSYETADYFLENYGHPIRILGRIKTGLLVYIGGTPPPCDENVLRLDLTKTLMGKNIIIKEFMIKNTFFPIEINSLSKLDAALTLTGKELKDIIIKPCIIYKSGE